MTQVVKRETFAQGETEVCYEQTLPSMEGLGLVDASVPMEVSPVESAAPAIPAWSDRLHRVFRFINTAGASVTQD
jgi:hypothetical protein